jgi:hypothetical protein
MRNLISMLAFSAILTGCTNGIRWLDASSFGSFGTTVVTDPQQVSLKEVHLDAGQLVGQTIVIEGSVVTIGKYQTHLVLADSTARMLVVLTKVHDTTEEFEKRPPKALRILGTVERGKKGLPYVSAIAVNEIPPSKA